jgi:DNA-damage-inducible protein J
MNHMAKTEYVHVRIEPEIKHDAENVLAEIGLSTSDAITLFFKQIALFRGLPFPVQVPNERTRRAIAEARERENLETFDSFDDWVKEAQSL